MSRRDHDVVVVGGGPAGASAACLLAQAGRMPLLIEREAAPRHKVCGEFLSIEARASLHALGLRPEALGGVPIGLLRLVCGQAVVEAELPFEGIGLTRRALDEALLRHAERSGADVRRGVSVRQIATVGPDLRASLSSGEVLRAATLLLATGKHDVRGAKRPTISGSEDLIGFKVYFRLNPVMRRELEGAIEVLLFEGGYAGLQLVEGGLANLCLLIRRTLFERLGKSWDGLLRYLREDSRHLKARLTGAEPTLDRPLSIARIPYGFVHHPDEPEPDGLFRLGDQAGVIHSFSGDGVSIALHTGRLAAATYLAAGNVAPAFHRQVRADIGRQIRVAALLYQVSQAPAGRSALITLCRMAPGLMRTIALWTRVPAAAVRRTGVALPLQLKA